MYRHHLSDLIHFHLDLTYVSFSSSSLLHPHSSTVQILGAEKALFRALKARTNTPKYGLLYHSSFIGRAGLKNKGRISRFLANKCSIASRIDCFLEQPTHIYGDSLKQQVEDRLKFYESGETPRKNIEVMKEAMELVAKDTSVISSEKKKKKKKRKDDANASGLNETNGDATMDLNETNGDGEVKKKKKKRKSDLNGSELNQTNGDDTLDLNETTENGDGESKKKKKKNKQNQD